MTINSLVGGDFLLDAAGAYTLNASASNLSIQVPLIDDGVFELSETLTASLSFLNEAPPRVTISPSSAEVRIEDDDGLYAHKVLTCCVIYPFVNSVLVFGFDPDAYEFGEDSGTNALSVSLSGNPGEFTAVLTAGADGDSAIDTATGT